MQRFGYIGKHSVHLFTRLEPLLLGVNHARRVVKVLACSQTKQVVVSLSRFLVFKMAIVCTYQFDAIFFRKALQNPVDFLLERVGFAIGPQRRVGNLMALKLQIEVVTEEVMIPFQSLASRRNVALHNLLRYLSAQTGRAYNKSFMIFFEVEAVGSRPVIIPVNP